MAPLLPYAAYLRVYQPLPAFPNADRSHWRAYADSPHRPRRVVTLAAEHEESLRRVASGRIAPCDESEYAYVRRRGAEVFVCPWQTRLRSLVAFRTFLERTPRPLATVCLPADAAERATRALASWQEGGGTLRTQILTSTWTIPAAWFLPFSAAERCLILGTETEAAKAAGVEGREPDGMRAATPDMDAAAGHGPPGTDGRASEDGWGPWVEAGWPESVMAPPRTLLYLTTMREARRRTDHSVEVLRRALGDCDLLAAAEQVRDWLCDWHPRSLVELDYGGMVRLLDDAALLDDQSPAEVAAIITGLADDEREVALAMYQRVTLRWHRVQGFASAN